MGEEMSIAQQNITNTFEHVIDTVMCYRMEVEDGIKLRFADGSELLFAGYEFWI